MYDAQRIVTLSQIKRIVIIKYGEYEIAFASRLLHDGSSQIQI